MGVDKGLLDSAVIPGGGQEVHVAVEPAIQRVAVLERAGLCVAQHGLAPVVVLSVRRVERPEVASVWQLRGE